MMSPVHTGGEGGGEGFRTLYTYNLDRQLTLVTRPDGQTLSLGYDTGGRLSTLTLPGSVTTNYAYSATTGTLSSITTPNSTLSYEYDGSLLLSSTWAGTVAGSVSRTYDTNFRVATQSVNGANTVNFGYDTDSLLTSAGSLTITRSAQNGLITGSTLDVVTDSRSYSTFGELSTYSASVSGAPVFNVTYTRDKLGRITQKVETIGGSTDTFVYTYDTAGRLADVQKNSAVVGHYSYDSNGNRLSQTDQSGTVNGTYDAQDRLMQYGNLQYTYTANGELATKTNPVLGQTASFTHDVLGNLKSATLPGGVQIDYVVDGQNRRIGKKINGVLVQGFLYQNQLNPVAELDGSGNVVSRFVYGTKANVPDYMIKGGVTYRIVSDHLGSPRLVINTTDGSIAQRMEFDEFGNITADTNPGFQPFGFAGGLYDQHTGLTRFGARDYDAQVGRWTAKDPIKFVGGDTNLYGYALNDPVNIVDPSGKLLPLIVIIPVVAGVVNGVFSAIAASQACDATALKTLEAFGNGAVGGIVGSYVGLGVGAATGNPFLAGAAGGLISNLVEQSLEGQGIDPVAATVATVGGGIGGAVAPKLFPLAGRRPGLTTLRKDFGPNSYRFMGQEAASELIEGSVGAAAGGLANAISGSRSNGCGC
jgi:RHS repeat-associated protein